MGNSRLTQSDIESAFAEIGERAKNEGHVIEMSVYGGAAIMLAYGKRQMTKDVDAVFEESKHILSALAKAIAASRNWDEDWLNDGVKGWLSHLDSEPDSKRLLRSYPSEEDAGLRVMVASPHYLFAMKCMAMRLGGVSNDGETEETSDIADIRFLATEAGINSSEEAIDVVSSFKQAYKACNGFWHRGNLRWLDT